MRLFPNDVASLDKWGEYTEAKETMFFYTDTDTDTDTDTADAPWTVVKSNDRKRARLDVVMHNPRSARRHDHERSTSTGE
ncbi:hypothetical protein [Krasilnikovia sp. M28-CT-15]|uniref:hypothetical protein n=1 Tax=Krasilnikovia sp. M28-CT-15 TaxID=3373540 RepID=UPI0038778D28